MDRAEGEQESDGRKKLPIYVVSGGLGASGEQVARTVLAQFARASVRLEIVPRVRSRQQVQEVVDEARGEGGLLVHTMVNRELGAALDAAALEAGVVAVDLMGPLLDHLTKVLGQEPAGQPGLFRQLHKSYFDRVEAIEFTVVHDDGKRREDLAEAEIVLIGVSRVGKTPLSIYLSILGWKVANVPLVLGLEPPKELFEVDRRRVIGLSVEPAQLLSHRRWRQQHMGIGAGSYVDREQLVAEMRDARHLFSRHGFTVIDVTNKPIETSADEIIAAVSRWVDEAKGEAPR